MSVPLKLLATGLTGLAILICDCNAHAQSQAVRFTRGAVLTADQLMALQAAKLDAINGNAKGLTVTQRLTTPAGQFDGPQSGASLGVGAQTYLAPNQVVPGSLSVQGNAPIIHLGSFLHAYPLDIWMSPDGAGNMSVNDPVSGTFNLFTHNFNIGGTNGGAVVNLYGGGTGGAMQIFQASTGEGWLTTPGYSLNISAGSASVQVLSPIKNSGMPTSAPSSGAHYVCADDAGDIYRSDSACR